MFLRLSSQHRYCMKVEIRETGRINKCSGLDTPQRDSETDRFLWTHSVSDTESEINQAR